MNKVELHLHLDCSLSYRVAVCLEPSLSRAQYDQEFVAPAKCFNLADFLTRAPRGFQLMQTVEALRLVTEDLFQQLTADQVIYSEIRFAPLLHTLQGLSPSAVVDAVNRAAEGCIRATGTEARLILCTLRHFTEQQSMSTARLVREFQGSLVTALDIAGDEAGYPIDAHVSAFRYAIDQGLFRTAHAGEARGAESVWETLQAFQPSRIGHGVRSTEDPRLVEHLREQRIHLEVCPTSNVQTNLCPDYADHAVDELYRAGVPLSISTDTRTITNVTLREEYARLARHFGWQDSDFLACNRAALQAAFVEQPVREALLSRVELGLAAR